MFKKKPTLSTEEIKEQLQGRWKPCIPNKYLKVYEFLPDDTIYAYSHDGAKYKGYYSYDTKSGYIDFKFSSEEAVRYSLSLGGSFTKKGELFLNDGSGSNAIYVRF